MAISKKQIEAFKEILLERRTSLLGQVDSLAKSAASSTESTETSKSPLSPAENASDAYEQDFAFITMESEEGLVRAIDKALLRIREGTYGVCDECETDIGGPRLEAMPSADLCIKCQEKEELGLLIRRSAEEFEVMGEENTALTMGDDD